LSLTSVEGNGVVQYRYGISGWATLTSSVQIPVGTNVEIQALADTGWTFSAWTDDAASKTAELSSIVMNSDHAIGAIFTDDDVNVIHFNISLTTIEGNGIVQFRYGNSGWATLT
jgi:hypothetical protein